MFLYIFLLLLNLNAHSPPVNGEILTDTNNLTISKVWETYQERGYAYDYLLNEGIKKISTGFIKRWIEYGNYAASRQLLTENEALLLMKLFSRKP